MAVRSRRLLGPVAIVALPTVISQYEVPAGRTLIVKTIILRNNGVVADTVDFPLGGSGMVNSILQVPIAAGAIELRSVYWILNPLDKIRTRATTGNVYLTIMGVLLFGSPE